MTANQPARGEGDGPLPGDITGLVEQLGAESGAFSMTAPAGWPLSGPVTDIATLRQFVREYRTRVLGPLELPSIQLAFHHAARHQVRELIELDQRIGQEPLFADFAAASRQVGKQQMKRLRPLRDQRMLQRYLAAVQSGAAHGWHTVVYGLIVSIYSLPLRPALVTFAEQTLRGFIHSGARRLDLAESESVALIGESSAGVPGLVDQVMGGAESPERILTVA